MVTISVIYPRGQGAHFDYDYYIARHLPLVSERWSGSGLTGVEALRGMAGAEGGEAPFFAIALIRFASMELFQAAMGGEHAAAVLGDIPNFTSVQPIVQMNDTIYG